jgi:DNA-binding transcriptional LysR family regulator
MEEKDWVLLKILYEEKNITKAASRLYTSQPALTYRIKQIEKEFGTNILLRSKKGVEFTSEGYYLVDYANSMVRELQNVKDNILNISSHVSGNLRLGVSSNFAHYKLPKILKDFLSQYPNVQVNVTTGWSSEIITSLQREEVQIGIVRGDNSWNEGKILIHEEPLCLISSKEIKMDQLNMLPRIDYKTDHSLKQVIQEWWSFNFHTPPKITMIVDKVETCIEMVKHDLGYAIVPHLCLNNSHDLHISPIYNKNNQPLKRKTWLIYRNSSLELSALKAFVDEITSHSYDDLHKPSS